eukprot:TRINITY_DN7510_c0_g1_i3.p1 TRINITY_DN7510_c0_g1~~TRINITY_DN7510_c0_g1_i3.p1  ORF type:complete len:173 (-),score=18.96 TRINITY_DN7510_c0_g1_i3:39-557(-)
MAFSGRQATGPTMAGSRSGYPEHHSRYQRAAVGIGGGEGVGAGCSGHAPQQSESSRAISSGATRSGSCGRTNGVAGLATTSAVPANVLDRGPSTDGGGCADTIRADRLSRDWRSCSWQHLRQTAATFCIAHLSAALWLPPSNPKHDGERGRGTKATQTASRLCVCRRRQSAL